MPKPRRLVTQIVDRALAVALALAPALAGAGDGSTEPTRVRVTSPSGRIVGTLVHVDEQALTVRTSGKNEDVRLVRDTITKVEVSRRRGNRALAVGFWLLAGAAIGSLVDAKIGEDDDVFARPLPIAAARPLLDRPDHGETSTASGVIYGAPVGALVGLCLSHGEDWETTASEGLRIAIVPKRGGGAIRLSFSF